MDCYIHIDKKIDRAPFNDLLDSIPQVFFIQKRVDIRWAGYGTIQATLNGFDEILKSNRDYHYLHVMSGQDYPIKSNKHILKFVTENFGQEFFDLLHDKWPEDIATRYTKYHLINSTIPGKYVLGGLMTKLLPKRKFPLDGPVWGSSNWFMVTSECAEYLIKKIKGTRSLKRFFRLVWGADEFIFINIVRRSSFKDRINKDGIHFMEWEKEDAHAKLLTSEHLDRLSKSDKLFARKIDISQDPTITKKLNDLIKSGEIID